MKDFDATQAGARNGPFLDTAGPGGGASSAQLLLLPNGRLSLIDLILARGGQPERVRQILRFSIASALSNLVNATIVAVSLWGVLPHGWIIAWYAVACLLTGWIFTQRKLGNRLKIRRISPRTLRRQAIVAAVLAAPWSVVALALVIAVPEEAKFAPFMAMVVHLVGGAIVFSAVPLLTMIFTGVVMLPATLLALAHWQTLDLLFATPWAVLGVMLTRFSLYYGFVTSEKELSESRRQESLRNLSSAHENITQLAETDVVTGLVNRRAFQAHLEGLMARLNPQQPLSHILYLIDLDHFKHINDAYGHEVGDRYLISVAGRLAAMSHLGLTVARLGGDEFAAVSDAPWPNAEAERIGALIVAALAQSHVVDGLELKGGCSIGAAQAPMLCANASELLTYADQALRRAKSVRRGSLVVYSGWDKDKLRKRSADAVALERAVRTGAVEAFYQPQIDLGTGALVGFEALARWRGADGGQFVPPPHFFALAEEHGFVLDLCDAIWRRIAQTARQWREAGLDFGSIAVNVHPAQLNHEQRLFAGLAALSEAAGGRARIVLEITEDCVIGRGMEHVPGLLARLAELGHRISLDDFGTGFASLTHIKELPIHELKIDRKFVADLAGNAQDKAIVKAVCDIARPRQIMVVAEGVETNEQLLALAELGGRVAQGYLFSRPEPAEQAVAFMATRQGIVATLDRLRALRGWGETSTPLLRVVRGGL